MDAARGRIPKKNTLLPLNFGYIFIFKTLFWMNTEMSKYRLGASL